jgi:hypothetical protein
MLLDEPGLVLVNALNGRARSVPVGPLLLDLSLDRRRGRLGAGSLSVRELPGGQPLPVGLDRLLSVAWPGRRCPGERALSVLAYAPGGR